MGGAWAIVTAYGEGLRLVCTLTMLPDENS